MPQYRLGRSWGDCCAQANLHSALYCRVIRNARPAFGKPVRAPVNSSILRRNSVFLPWEPPEALSFPQHLVSSTPHTWLGLQTPAPGFLPAEISSRMKDPSIPRHEDRWHLLSCSALLPLLHIPISEESSVRSRRAVLIWEGWTRHQVHDVG